jgi:hypothetical protein
MKTLVVLVLSANILAAQTASLIVLNKEDKTLEVIGDIDTGAGPDGMAWAERK